VSISDKIQEQAREMADKLKRQYQQRMGEELAAKKRELDERENSLDRRERDIAQREATLAKYFLVPRIYVHAPLAILFCVAAVGVYLALKPVSPSIPRENSQSTATSSIDLEPDYGTCVQRGIRYYKEIGSYPVLSSGADAESQVREMCSNSGFAFPE
jgi:hypothetical protein